MPSRGIPDASPRRRRHLIAIRVLREFRVLRGIDKYSTRADALGIVWLRIDFGAGSVPNRRAGPPTTELIVREAFKVYGGQLHAVEAFMEAAPMDAKSGWD